MTSCNYVNRKRCGRECVQGSNLCLKHLLLTKRSWAPSAEHWKAARRFTSASAHKEYVPLDLLPPTPEHLPRASNIGALIVSLQENPSTVPPLALVFRSGRYEVVDGYHRTEAARREGLTHVPAWVTVDAGIASMAVGVFRPRR